MGELKSELQKKLDWVEGNPEMAIKRLASSTSAIAFLKALVLLKEMTEFLLTFFKERSAGNLNKFGWKIMFNKKVRKEFMDIIKALFGLIDTREFNANYQEVIEEIG